ncbi:MAG: nitrate reductase molybdenum cofactor assembly chaperone [Acidobacteria bacterium]|nr:nitrate reductase molybdenum cofactor assembly chaperone [Acidobacteriota bacterium]
MPHSIEMLACLVRLFEYPGPDYPDQIERCLANFASAQEESAAILRQFLSEIRDRSLSELEELYIQTFDLNPAACLDIGWHLFGEDYARGEFLVKMNQEIRRYGLAESHELPDHITRVLPVLARMEDSEARRFQENFLDPAWRKLSAAVGADNPYSKLLSALACVLEIRPEACQKETQA